MKYLFLFALTLFYSCMENNVRKETELDLSSKRITTIPDSIFEYKNLKKLDLGAKEITFYPPLSALPESDNEKNQITELPEKLSELQQLKVLILNSNNLKSLPNSISTLKNLEVLDLALNKNLDILAEIPKLKLLSELKVLKITDSRFNIADIEIIQKLLGPKVKVVSSINDYFETNSVEITGAKGGLAK